ncbi:MAG: acyl-CoA dehydrogenase family protein, partial [Acidimicrobiales bacterium]
MIEWNDEQQMVRAAVRDFIEKELVPHHRDLEHGDLRPYDIIRKLFSTFGMDAMARDRFARQIARDKDPDAARTDEGAEGHDPQEAANAAAFQIIPIIELSRWSPGMVTAMGVSMGLTAAAILSRGTVAQKERWALPLLTMEKIGAWAITEPGSGSDAFGSMRSTARRDGDEYVLNGSKTFITNGLRAHYIVLVTKTDPDAGHDGLTLFVVDIRDENGKEVEGFSVSRKLEKMGMHASDTGELTFEDVRIPAENMLGEEGKGFY